MKERVSLEAAAKKEMEPRKITKAEAKEEEGKLKESHSEMMKWRATFMRCCHHVELFKMHVIFGHKTEEEYIASIFPGQKLGIHTYREAKRVFKAFLGRVSTFPEFRGDRQKAEAFTESVIDRLDKTFENNTEYTKEMARTNILGSDKREAEENLREAAKIFRNVKDADGNIDKFIKTARDAFGIANEGKVKASAKRADRASVSGSKIGLNARVDSAKLADIAEVISAVANEAGIRKEYSDMSSDDLGDFTHLLALKAKVLFPKLLKTQAQRKSAAATGVKSAVMALLDATLTDEQLDEVMDEFVPIIERVVAKA